MRHYSTLSLALLTACAPDMPDHLVDGTNEQFGSVIEAADTGLDDSIPDSFISQSGQLFDYPVDFLVAINKDEAMDIAVQDLNPSYSATSAIFGPMDWDKQAIMAYEVTVNGGDHFLLRYINAGNGELLYDVEHSLQLVDESSQDDIAPRAYYTSCPGGWPLCIKTPSSITFYSQNDPSWKSVTLGYGPSTIGSGGCLLSSYDMMLRYNGFTTKNPKDLNSFAKTNSCFSGDLISGSCLASKLGASYTTIGVDSVWGKLASGKPVVTYGYSSCMGSNHAQMLWGHDGSRYWAKDPYYDWANQDQSLCVSSPSYRVMQ